MKASTRILMAALALLAASPAAAQNAPPVTRLRGTVAAFDGHTLAIDTREGTRQQVTIKDDARLSAVVALDFSAIRPGGFIGTAAVPAKGGDGLVALEVVVFPEAMRGTGEGHYSWDLAPESSMTNANVDAVVTATTGRSLQLSYKGGDAKVLVPPEAPVVTFVPAERSELTPGTPVYAVASPAADGGMATGRVVIGRDGVRPPM